MNCVIRTLYPSIRFSSYIVSLTITGISPHIITIIGIPIRIDIDTYTLCYQPIEHFCVSHKVHRHPLL